jgi:hypothetical protein
VYESSRLAAIAYNVAQDYLADYRRGSNLVCRETPRNELNAIFCQARLNAELAVAAAQLPPAEAKSNNNNSNSNSNSNSNNNNSNSSNNNNSNSNNNTSTLTQLELAVFAKTQMRGNAAASATPATRPGAVASNGLTKRERDIVLKSSEAAAASSASRPGATASTGNSSNNSNSNSNSNTSNLTQLELDVLAMTQVRGNAAASATPATRPGAMASNGLTKRERDIVLKSSAAAAASSASNSKNNSKTISKTNSNSSSNSNSNSNSNNNNSPLNTPKPKETKRQRLLAAAKRQQAVTPSVALEVEEALSRNQVHFAKPPPGPPLSTGDSPTVAHAPAVVASPPPSRASLYMPKTAKDSGLQYHVDRSAWADLEKPDQGR